MSDATEGKREPQGPPADVPASELFLAMMALPVPHEVVDFPMKEPVFGKAIAKVAIVPLAPEELMMCRKIGSDWAAGLHYGKGAPAPKAGDETQAFKDNAADEVIVQILWRALRDPNDKTLGKYAFNAPKVLRYKPFTADILGVLFKMYLRTCVVHGPVVATMTKEEMNAWLDALEEGGAGFPLDLLSLGMLSELLMHSVARFKASRTANGSSGQPPADASTESMPMPPSESPPTLSDSETPPSAVADELLIPKA